MLSVAYRRKHPDQSPFGHKCDCYSVLDTRAQVTFEVSLRNEIRGDHAGNPKPDTLPTILLRQENLQADRNRAEVGCLNTVSWLVEDCLTLRFA